LAGCSGQPAAGARLCQSAGTPRETDKVDAHVLALFAEKIRPPVRALPDETLQAVVDWLTRRRQLVEILMAEKNRSHQAQEPFAGT